MANINDEVNKPAEGGEGAEKARPKKKSTIAAVFNPQYSRQGREASRDRSGSRPSRDSRDNRDNRDSRDSGNRSKNAQGKPAASAAKTGERTQSRKPAQQAPAQQSGRPIIKPRPVGERAMRPASERIKAEEAVAETPIITPVKEEAPVAAPVKGETPAPAPAPVPAPAAEIPAERPNVYRMMEEKARQEALAKKEAQEKREERPNVYRNNGENRGDRSERPNVYRTNNEHRGENRGENRGERGDRPARRDGERPNVYRTNNGENRGENRTERGDRPARRDGDRPNFRNNGERNGERQGRPFGENRGERTGERQGRPFGENRGDRNNDRGGERQGRGFGENRGERSGDRPNGQNRFGGQGRFNKESAAPAAEEVRGKESRERGAAARRNNTGKPANDHDKLGKKQENYINLEKHGGKKRPQQPQAPKEDPNEIKTIVLPEKMTLKELADAMKQQPSVLIKNLFMKGEMCTMNTEITYEKAEELAMEFNIVCEQEEKVDVIAELLKEDEESEDIMIKRPPVVCVMGHVDHGKTSLLDAIRSTRVTAREAGGITQHIGASVVEIDGQKITFLDTPGHEAFTAMRMRGANSTDIAILVVAADDGVMPQTIEAINHAKAAEVEIIVAINKIDKVGANIERVKQELTEYGLVAEDWGGSTVFCPVSAKTGEGIDDLLEMVLLTADVLELKANPKRNARGLVIEAQLDKGRGSVATVLVQKGTLHVGDCVACGSSYGKVRAMLDDKGVRVKEAVPSTPVEILGLNSVPAAGETFVVCDNEKDAKSFAETYIAEEKKRLLEETKQRLSLESLFSQIQAGNVKELNLIVKADVQGSVEAVKTSLMKLSNEEVVVKVIHGGVGAISESDVILASASNAIIIGFNVRPDTVAKATAEHENVEIRLYNVIYTAIEEIERKMKGMKDPVYEEKILGHAEIRMIFKASGVGNIAGSYVMDGIIERGCKVRISREGKQIWEGDLASLKRFKDDVKEVKTNYECGLVFDGFNDIQEFDIVEAYKMVEVKE